jgi:hypothetical protein
MTLIWLACVFVNYLQVEWFSSPLRYTCIRGINWWWCGYCVLCSTVRNIFQSSTTLLLPCYVVPFGTAVLSSDIWVEFYSLHCFPILHVIFQTWMMYCCILHNCSQATGRGPMDEPFTSSSNCYTTPQPSLFPLTLPAVELVAITFMNLQQFGFIGEYKYFRFSIPCIFIYVTIRITNSCDFFCTVSLFHFSRLFPTCFGLLWAHHQGYLQLLFLCYHLVHAVLCWSSACISGLVCGGDFSVLTEYTEVTTTNQFADARRRSTKHCMNQMVA